MPRERHNPSLPTAPLSVTQVADRLGLSRRRFYELVQAGKFPPPVYLLSTRKPIYTSELQTACDQIKATGLAFDGSVIVFNIRKDDRTQPRPTRRSSGGGKTKHDDLIEYLQASGVSASETAVTQAIQAAYPDGTEGAEQGMIWRDVVRILRSASRGR